MRPLSFGSSKKKESSSRIRVYLPPCTLPITPWRSRCCSGSTAVDDLEAVYDISAKLVDQVSAGLVYCLEYTMVYGQSTRVIKPSIAHDLEFIIQEYNPGVQVSLLVLDSFQSFNQLIVDIYPAIYDGTTVYYTSWCGCSYSYIYMFLSTPVIISIPMLRSSLYRSTTIHGCS
jgi:hypothetical protein